MNILILIQIFETKNDTGSDRHFYFAKKLVEAGHNVTVVTANVDYKNAKQRFRNKSRVYKKNIEGINIKYLSVFTNFRGSLRGRFKFFLSFFFSSIRHLFLTKDIDIVYSVSTPLSVGILGALSRLIIRKPVIFEVTDVWPDAAIETGLLSNNLIIIFARIVEKLCYLTATKIICLTKGIFNNIKSKGVPTSKLKLITNGVDFDLFKEVNPLRVTELRKKFNLNDKFVVLYLGAHGLYNSLETILKSAKELNNNKNIFFVLIGDGDEKSSLIEYAKQNHLSNVLFLGTIPRIKSVEILSIADIFLLPNRKGKFFYGNLPNKLFDYLASARPVLIAGHGESAELIKAAKSGTSIKPDDPVLLSNTILSYSKMSRSKLKEIGANGRDFVFRFYSRSSQAEILIAMINAI